MTICSCYSARPRLLQRGFTLVEVVVALLLAAVGCGGILAGYTYLTDQAEWSAHSLAAQAQALQCVEQARAAQWDTQTWPNTDELGVTNLVSVVNLNVPLYSGMPCVATNFLTVSTVSTKPPVRMLRADCVWTMPSRKAAIRGPFTNTVITYRAADQ